MSLALDSLEGTDLPWEGTEQLREAPSCQHCTPWELVPSGARAPTPASPLLVSLAREGGRKDGERGRDEKGDGKEGKEMVKTDRAGRREGKLPHSACPKAFPSVPTTGSGVITDWSRCSQVLPDQVCPSPHPTPHPSRVSSLSPRAHRVLGQGNWHTLFPAGTAFLA